MSRRPEHLAPPEVFYNFEEARKYTKNTRMMEIQNEMSERAIELLALPEDEPCFVLDIGCGSGSFTKYFDLRLETSHFFLFRFIWGMPG